MTGEKLIFGSVLITLVVLCALVYAVLSNGLPQEDGSVGECLPTYPGGAGSWELDGTCWYIHTTAEFDTNPPDACAYCHNGVDAAEW